MALESVDLGFQPENVLAMHIQLPQATVHANGPSAMPSSSRCWNGCGPCRTFVRPAVYRLGWDITDALIPNEVFDQDFSVPGQADSAPRHVGASWSSRRTTLPPWASGFSGVRRLSRATRTPSSSTRPSPAQCFPDTDPLGQSLYIGRAGGPPQRIVGVVDTVRSFETPALKQGVVYGRERGFLGFAVLLVRTMGDPAKCAPAIRQQVAALEKDQVIETLEPLTTTLSRMLAPRRFVMILLSLFAGIALALATVGVYGLLQYSTTQQTHDIGIRMALGARKADILRGGGGAGPQAHLDRRGPRPGRSGRPDPSSLPVCCTTSRPRTR